MKSLYFTTLQATKLRMTLFCLEPSSKMIFIAYTFCHHSDRDGVSESQFDECLEVELTAFKRVCFITMLQSLIILP